MAALLRLAGSLGSATPTAQAPTRRQKPTPTQNNHGGPRPGLSETKTKRIKMSIRQQLDEAYEKSTLAPLRAEAKKQAEANDAYHANKSLQKPSYTDEEMAYLASQEAEMNEAIEKEIKRIVAQNHCSRGEAKKIMRKNGW
jgi:hypothetical protein